MYSILIKVSSKNYIYDANEEGEVFSGDETEVKARYSKSIADFYADFSKKYDDFNKDTMFLH